MGRLHAAIGSSGEEIVTAIAGELQAEGLAVMNFF
jgi:hypothetical protein